MTKDEALELALEELENCADLLKVFEAPIDSCVGASMLQAEKAITAIKQALAQPVQPVAWAMYQRGRLQSFWLDKGDAYDFEFTPEHEWKPLYTTPPVQPAPAPDYAWPTVADYEKDVGFEVNDAFKMAWAMARTTNALFTQMEKNA